MLHSRFFWRLYLTYAVLVLATSGSIGWLVHSRLRESSARAVEDSLRNQSSLLSAFAVEALAHERNVLRSEVTRLGAEIDARITLIALDGRVIADSHEDPARLENHRNRPEVLEASREPFGIARRFSYSLGYPMLYVARRAPSLAEPEVVVRVALDARDVDESLAVLGRTVAFGAGVGALFALGLGLVVARRITSPIDEMTAVADALRAGHYERRVVTLPSDEIGVLGETLNRLGEEITERVRTIRIDEARLRAILAGMVEGVVAVDNDDRVIFCNAAARRMLDLGDAELRGRPLWELVRIAGLANAMEDPHSSAGGIRREFTLPAGGREIVVEALVNPFHSDAARGRIIVLHDVSELRRLEQIRRDFVANVSHELKTPLTSIQGYVETLLSGALSDSENAARFLERIQSNVERLSFLVSDLLSLARVESQRDELDLVPLDLFDVVRMVASDYEREEELRDIELVIEAGECDGRQVIGEREALREVVDNLLSNAFKYTPSGGRVTVTAELDPAHVTLVVSDTGIGIPAGDLDRVFERFYRVDKARSRDLGGTGLGLSIVKHLTLAMGGEVDVESHEGRGSRFRVRLPLGT